MASLALGVKFNPALGGTTDWVYSSAVTGYVGPAVSNPAMVDGKTYRYRAESADLSQWEWGFGVYTASTQTIARSTITLSSTGSKVSFSAPPMVGVVPFPADVLQFDDAMSLTAAQQSQGRSNLGAAYPGMHNRLINPSGQIWQRANSGAAAITDIIYAFDRWYGLTQTAGITASQVTNAENGTPFMMRLSQANATAQRMGIAQAIESANCIDLRGQTVCLSARVQISASTTLRFAIIEWTGTADTVTKDFVLSWTSGTFTAGNFFTSTSTVITATGSIALTANTLASISLNGTIGSSANNVAVLFWTDSAQAQNVTMDIGKAQLEVGADPTPLALRSYGDELRDRYRCYYRLSAASSSAAIGMQQAIGAGATVGTYLYLPVEMRAVPVGAVSSPSHIRPTQPNGAGGGVFGTFPFDSNSPRSLGTNAAGTTGGSGLSIGNATAIVFASASGWIDATAEL